MAATKHAEDGFTLVEILVVIMIIGILAVVAFPIFLGQKDKASDADAMALARTGHAAMETYAVHHGNYAAGEADVLDIAPELQNAPAWVLTTAAKTFVIDVESRDGRIFRVERLATGEIHRSCAPLGGGCKTGVW